MWSAFFWDVTQRRVVILYRRFGTTYRSHLQRSRSQRIRRIKRPIHCPETSVKDYHSALRNILEESGSNIAEEINWVLRIFICLLWWLLVASERNRPWLILRRFYYICMEWVRKRWKVGQLSASCVPRRVTLSVNCCSLQGECLHNAYCCRNVHGRHVSAENRDSHHVRWLRIECSSGRPRQNTLADWAWITGCHVF
jgi:hypothetical protein